MFDTNLSYSKIIINFLKIKNINSKKSFFFIADDWTFIHYLIDGNSNLLIQLNFILISLQYF